MKKIFAILLALTMALSVFALAGCGDNGGDVDTTDPKLEAFTNALSATKPQSTDIEIKVVSGLGITLEGEYNVTYNSDGTATVEYSYDRLNTFEDGPVDELVSRITGTASIAADGTVSGDISATVAGAATKSFNLDAAKLKSYTAGEGSLVATIAAENVGAVLGTAISNLASDVTISMFANGGMITAVSIVYTDSVAGAVTVECVYN